MIKLNLEIITPSKIAFKSEVKSVTLPGVKGAFQVLKDHAMLISLLDIGIIKIVTLENNELYFACGGGSAEVLDNKLLVLVESIESQDEIDAERAKIACARARERLKAALNNKDVDFDRANVALTRALNRLKLITNKF